MFNISFRFLKLELGERKLMFSLDNFTYYGRSTVNNLLIKTYNSRIYIIWGIKGQSSKISSLNDILLSSWCKISYSAV